MATLTTPRFAIPWPDGTERVMDGDNAMGAIANKLDSLGLAFAVAGGVATMVAPGGTTNPSIAITFPAGRFTQIPLVIACLNTGTLNFLTNVGSVTTTGATITVFGNTAGANVTNSTYLIGWLAVQMLPGATNG